MEYRFVRLSDDDTYLQIFNEEDSQLIGSVLRRRRYLISRKYLVRLEHQTFEIRQGLLARRSWKVVGGEEEAKIQFSLFGDDVCLKVPGQQLAASGVERGKLTLTTQKGRTAVVMDPELLSSPDMVIVEDFDRVKITSVLAAAVLLGDKYHLWQPQST